MRKVDDGNAEKSASESNGQGSHKCCRCSSCYTSTRCCSSAQFFLQLDSLLPTKFSCGYCAQSCRSTHCYQQNSVVATVKHGLTFDLRSWDSKSRPCLKLLREKLVVGRRILCTNLLQTYATNSLQALGECCLSWPHTRTLYFETRDPSPTRRQL